ncbi:MAG TPA: NADH dehydrogenase subunit [Mariniphaga anaerophila]|uniref:NADH dehydrogenase subunit n=1 Tax=Mariniphaga anaerophila TaxID=1484053 RepID=A0A831LUL7_9BACT|nr:NADH dehydrogenase subunit [Mariniphaga anaerophila]
MVSENKKYPVLNNNGSVGTEEIPVLDYEDFSTEVVNLLQKKENHCVTYFAYHQNNGLKFIIGIANDVSHHIFVLSHFLLESKPQKLDSLTPKINALHIFEREIHENHGVDFPGHPWLKPVRFAHNRANKNLKVNDYPFYTIESDELHEVGVGPVHAGIIEPGHFRFICNGENVLHLEIQLGWQHRGVEQTMLEKQTLIQRNMVAESIAGDTTVGHSIAFARLMESLAGLGPKTQLEVERAVALELERIAVHTADISALCTDVAYNLGANIFGILRTLIINFTQSWCGNRLGKSMIRVGGTNYPFTNETRVRLLQTLAKYENQFVELAHLTYRLPSVENRFDDIGTITEQQALQIGAVGMVARMANVLRDIRATHPSPAFEKYNYSPVVLPKGDVFSRFLLRRKEIKQSIAWLREVMDNEDFLFPSEAPKTEITLKPLRLAISLEEGWRGEICHTALTDKDGKLACYKIKDPSMHNWKALELSLRNLEISDFPINNKSYNLSYCGFDL